MKRSVAISIDEDSWTTFGRTVPTELRPLSQTHNHNILTTMLRLGALTTPIRARGLSLNSFWAYIRYFGAFSSDASLRLQPDFYNLDPHQKTILSDDFGVAFSMEFLRDKLSLRRMCDGLYFMKHFAQKRGLTYANAPSVNGAQKCPDYICLGADGKIHLIECKGTQSGRTALRKQMERGIEQKNSINVIGPRAGEKLVAGLLIKKNTARLGSELMICDPVDRSPSITIDESDYIDAEDDIIVGDISRYVAASGLEDTSFFLSSRIAANELMTSGDTTSTTKSYLDRPYAESEMEDISNNDFTIEGRRYIGREQTIDLPKSFLVDGKHVSEAVVKSGIIDDLYLSLKEQAGRRSASGWPLFEIEKEFRQTEMPWENEDKYHGEIVESGVYASSIVLR